MKITQLVDRFGSNRSNADKPGKLLRGCSCIAIPFAGGMCEVPHFTANIINLNDLDRHVMNLCRVVRDSRAELVSWLDGTPYHPDQLHESQTVCRQFDNPHHYRDQRDLTTSLTSQDRFEWACNYFVASWMTRGGKGGTVGEFDAGLSMRWKSGGGDSAVRFRSAIEALTEWEQVMRRCVFHTLDAYEFLEECLKRDIKENGIYADRDWPDDGAIYKYTAGSQEKFRDFMLKFKKTRIVLRFGDHPIISELYPESDWNWHRLESRTQANDDKAEVLLERKR